MRKKKQFIALGITAILIAGLGAISIFCTNSFGSKKNHQSGALEIKSSNNGKTYKSYDFDTDKTPINNLDVEFATGNLTIRYGDSAKVEIKGSASKDIECMVSNETLVLRPVKKSFPASLLGSTRGSGDCTITLPADYKGNKSDITIAAGTLTIDGLKSDKISLEVAAGESKVYNMGAGSEFECSVGAGKLEISDSAFGHSSFEVGAGKLSCSNTTINGNFDLECGMGAANINLNNPTNNFLYEAECGLGSIQIGNEGISGTSEKTFGNKEAPYRADIECGLGNVTISFNE